MSDNPAIAAEQAFIAKVTAKLDAAESGESNDAEHEESDGSSPADDPTEHDTEDEGEDAAADGDDATEGATPDTADDTPADAKDQKEEDEDPIVAAEVKTALEKAGLKLTLKDIPAEARPIVRKKLDEVQAAFTRNQQQETKWRDERRAFLAEQKYREQNPELAIAEILKKNPELSDQVNDHVERMADPDKVRAFDSDVSAARQKAADALAAEESAVESIFKRADEIEVYLRRAAHKLGIPMQEAEEGVAFMLDRKIDALREAGRLGIDPLDVTEVEIDQVLTRKAKVYRAATRNRALEEKRAAIQGRARDRTTSTPAVRTGSGITAPAPGGKKEIRTEEEFRRHMLQKLGG